MLRWHHLPSTILHCVLLPTDPGPPHAAEHPQQQQHHHDGGDHQHNVGHEGAVGLGWQDLVAASVALVGPVVAVALGVAN